MSQNYLNWPYFVKKKKKEITCCALFALVSVLIPCIGLFSFDIVMVMAYLRPVFVIIALVFFVSHNKLVYLAFFIGMKALKMGGGFFCLFVCFVLFCFFKFSLCFSFVCLFCFVFQIDETVL